MKKTLKIVAVLIVIVWFKSLILPCCSDIITYRNIEIQNKSWTWMNINVIYKGWTRDNLLIKNNEKSNLDIWYLHDNEIIDFNILSYDSVYFYNHMNNMKIKEKYTIDNFDINFEYWKLSHYETYFPIHYLQVKNNQKFIITINKL